MGIFCSRIGTVDTVVIKLCFGACRPLEKGGIFKIKETRFTMKTKFILPIIALGLLAACNEESSPAAPVTNQQVPDPNQSVVVDPNNPGTDTLANQDPIVNPDPIVTPQVGGCNAIVRTNVTNPVMASEVSETGKYDYYGAELAGKDQFKYGRFEACMKMVSIPGSVSSMFLYYDDSYRNGVYPWNEIDIEVLGKGGTMWQSNIITREGDESIKKNTSSESKPLHEFGFDATEGFQLFAMVWTPDYVAWEIDSVEIRRDSIGLSRGTHADADQVAFLTEEQSLRFNLWASKSAAWVGKFTGEELANGPQVQWIDYVRVYSYDEATKSFTQLWQDDFDGDDYDRDRWGAGDWPMENVDLSRENVVVEDGYCKLLMTREPE